MKRDFVLVTGLMMLTGLPLGAQQRQINLTGAPAAALDEPFTSIAGAREVAPGKVVLADLSEQRLVLADLAGNAVRDIGSRGGGPGEWRFAMGVFAGPRGSAYVADPELRKMHVVDATGKIIRTVPFPGSDGGTSGTMMISIPRSTDAQGRFYATGRPFTPGESTQPDSVPIIRYDPTSSRTDTLAQIKNDTRVSQTGGGSGNMRVTARVGGGPYSPVTLWQPLPDGRLAIVHPEPYRVDIVGLDGRVQRGTPVPYTPIRVGKAERDAFRAASASAPRMAIRVGGGGATSFSSNAPGGDAPAIPDSDFPATMPPFTGNAMLVAPNGEIWVARSRAASDKTPTYDIWSATGQLVGRATLRANSTVVGFGQGAVYVARQDPEDDLRYLERYAL